MLFHQNLTTRGLEKSGFRAREVSKSQLLRIFDFSSFFGGAPFSPRAALGAFFSWESARKARIRQAAGQAAGEQASSIHRVLG